MMTLELYRFHDGKDDTLGMLLIDGVFSCFTVEDQAQPQKVMHETRIPAGVYPVKLRTSPKFTPKYGHDMLSVEEVPGFTGILIHKGNTEAHTSGCILLGNVARFNPRGNSRIEESGLAYARLYPIISQAVLSGSVKLFIFDTPAGSPSSL